MRRLTPWAQRRRLGWFAAAAISVVGATLAFLLLARPAPLLGLVDPPIQAASPPSGGRRPPTSSGGPPAVAWGQNIGTTVVLPQPLDRLPESGPYVLRSTELEMEPGSKIFEHRQIGVGAHVVVRGSIAIEDLDARRTTTYRTGQAYFEGLESLHRAENTGPEANRILMFDMLPASRKFDGAQRFNDRGRHNSGEIRSGPYVQVPLVDLPPPPLMLRVTELSFGPKARTVEHTRSGPVMLFVQEGTATVRKDWDNSSMTYGTNGYLYESGREPFILENKPPTPARFLAVEVLSASVGDGPSTIPTGRRAEDSVEG